MKPKVNLWQDDVTSKDNTQDLSVFKIDNLKYYIVKVIEKIFETFKKSYSIDTSNNVTVDFKDIFIVKYDNEHNQLTRIDEWFMSFQILLNNDFTGGGTIFDDGITINPEKGDLILHSAKVPHGGLPIKEGTRYLLIDSLICIRKNNIFLFLYVYYIYYELIII